MKIFNIVDVLGDSLIGSSVMYNDPENDISLKGIVEDVYIDHDDYYTYQFGGMIIARIRLTEKGRQLGDVVEKDETRIIGLEKCHIDKTLTIL